MTFLVYGPQKQLIAVWTRLFLLLFAEIHVTTAPWGIMMV
jgi:hypothetical protein